MGLNIIVVVLCCYSLSILAYVGEASGSVGRMHTVAQAARAEGLVTQFGVGDSNSQADAQIIVPMMFLILRGVR